MMTELKSCRLSTLESESEITGIDLSKPKPVFGDPRAMQQNNSTWNLQWDNNIDVTNILDKQL